MKAGSSWKSLGSVKAAGVELRPRGKLTPDESTELVSSRPVRVDDAGIGGSVRGKPGGGIAAIESSTVVARITLGSTGQLATSQLALVGNDRVGPRPKRPEAEHSLQ